MECRSGYLKFKDESRNTYLEDAYRCYGGSASLYVANLTYCDKTSFIYGINIINTNIILAEFCYDVKKSNLISAHYSAAIRSSYLNEQVKFNSL